MGDLENLQWIYHAEGNANIILKNHQTNQAMRLRKVPVRTNTSLSKFKKKIASTHSIQKEFEFFNCIVKPLLKDYSCNYIIESNIKTVPQTFVQTVKAFIDKERPESRKNKEILLCKQDVMVMPFLGRFNFQNVSNDEVFVCLELKPKWGFLPTSKYINPEHGIKKRVCRFCLHQVLKVKSRKVFEMSKFCPLDLYGSCNCQIKYALRSLFETPQNNLTVSVNGQHVPVCELEQHLLEMQFSVNCMDDLINLIAEILLHDSQQNSSVSIKQRFICSHSCFTSHETECKELGEGGVLNVLRKLQCLDDMDIEYIAKCLQSDMSTRLEREDILNYHSNLWQYLVKSIDFSSDVSSLETENINVNICKYLLSTTFKDCSVLVTICRTPAGPALLPEPIESVDTLFGTFFYQIKLVDLDPRLFENIEYYHYLDHKIVSTYTREETGVSCCN